MAARILLSESLSLSLCLLPASGAASRARHRVKTVAGVEVTSETELADGAPDCSGGAITEGRTAGQQLRAQGPLGAGPHGDR